MRTKIIGEIGLNHMNDFETGKKLIDLCIETGCSLAKLQLWKADDLFKGKDTYEQNKKFELSNSLATKFFDYGKENGMDIFFSVFYPEAVDFCEELGVKYYKLSNAFSINKEMVKKCLNTKKPVIISFSDYYPIDYRLVSNKQVIPLYVVPVYPPKYSDFNIGRLKKIIDAGGGYSNHYTDLFFPMLSVYLGASWIEAHIKLDNEISKGSPDDVCSLTADQLREFANWQNKVFKEQ